MMNIMPRIEAINAEIDRLTRDMANAPPHELDERHAQLKALQAELYNMLAALKAAQRPH